MLCAERCYDDVMVWVVVEWRCGGVGGSDAVACDMVGYVCTVQQYKVQDGLDGTTARYSIPVFGRYAREEENKVKKIHKAQANPASIILYLPTRSLYFRIKAGLRLSPSLTLSLPSISLSPRGRGRVVFATMDKGRDWKGRKMRGC